MVDPFPNRSTPDLIDLATFEGRYRGCPSHEGLKARCSLAKRLEDRLDGLAWSNHMLAIAANVHRSEVDRALGCEMCPHGPLVAMFAAIDRGEERQDSLRRLRAA